MTQAPTRPTDGDDSEPHGVPDGIPLGGAPAAVTLFPRWSRMPWPLELLTLLVGDVGYELIRALAPQQKSAAFRNAGRLLGLEPGWLRGLELWLDHLVNDHRTLALICGYYYTGLHLSVTAGVLVWLWWRRPQSYARARTVLFAVTFGALVVFWVFPVAPPRLAVPGAIDTIGITLAGHAAAIASSGAGTGGDGLVNPYAAFPSLHVAWAAWCAWAVRGHLPERYRRLAWGYPAATVLVVIGTANHYVLDVLAGLLALALAVLLIDPDARTRPATPGRTRRPDLTGRCRN